ncbi:MAG: XisI protein [Pyrinomonadaceae bacterium]|nr:XisI protein [Pyrinomonadaceae bacterium]
MDKIAEYREIIEKTLKEYAAIPYSYGNIKRRTIFDRENDTYMLFVEGWDNDERVHGILIHVDIIDGKIWIQRDGTEDGIALDFENEGIKKSEIVLAFHEPEVRKFTDYAVA